jgi:hypothetical protein
MVTVKVAIKGVALSGAALAIYVAAALQNGPEVADANFCKLLRRFSAAVPDQCLSTLDDYGTGVALIVALAFVILLLWDFKTPVQAKCTQAIGWTRPRVKKVSSKVEPHLILVGMLVAIVGIAIIGYGAWKKPAVTAATASPIGTGLEGASRLEHLEKEHRSTLADLAAAREQLASKDHELAQAKTSVIVTATKISAPYYTKADVGRLLEATYEITDLLQQRAVPARDAAQLFLKQWSQLLLEKGEPEFRAALKAVRLKMEAVNNDAWAISNKYQHYNSEIAPILAGVSFAEKFFGASNRFVEAGQNLPPVIDSKTLTFMIPMRDEYQAGVESMQAWMGQTFDRNRVATDRFRLLPHKDEPNP